MIDAVERGLIVASGPGPRVRALGTRAAGRRRACRTLECIGNNGLEDAIELAVCTCIKIASQ